MTLPRMTKTTLLALLLFVAVALLSPQRMSLIVYKVALVALAGVVGYVLDRALFPYGRPHDLAPDVRIGSLPPPELSSEERIARSCVFILAQLRRAAIVAAAMLAVGMGM